MPQLRLELSPHFVDRLDSAALFRDLHAMLVDTAGSTLLDCKSRIVEARAHRIGDGAPENAMAHLELRILEGRSPEVLRAVGERASALLRQHVEPAGAGLVMQLTVEIVVMERANYFKVVIGNPVG